MSIRNNKDDEHKTPHEELLDAVIEQRDNNPLPEQESEDELWESVRDIVSAHDYWQNRLKDLQYNFTIKRK